MLEELVFRPPGRGLCLFMTREIKKEFSVFVELWLTVFYFYFLFILIDLIAFDLCVINYYLGYNVLFAL